MRIVSHALTGMQGLNQKARAMGAIEEPVERETEDAGAGIVGQVHEQLERALASGASEAVLQHRCCACCACAAAALGQSMYCKH